MKVLVSSDSSGVGEVDPRVLLRTLLQVLDAVIGLTDLLAEEAELRLARQGRTVSRNHVKADCNPALTKSTLRTVDVGLYGKVESLVEVRLAVLEFVRVPCGRVAI
jgi:hypothetical protein